MTCVTAPGQITRLLRAFEYWAYQYRRTWRGTVVSGILTPVLFLSAMGVGLGSLVDDGGRLGGGYLQFLAPGLLAATAMQTAGFESMYPVLGAIKWIRTYHGMLATPLTVADVLGGHLLWVAFRVGSTSIVYVAVMALFGAAGSPWVLLAIPAATLCGMAFAAPIFAFSASRDDDAFAALNRFVLVPMFLFSGTFFPVSQLPGALQPVAYVTPLWHGVDLCRSLALGSSTWGDAAVHVAYLGAWLVVGIVVARIVFTRRLQAVS